MCVTVCVYIYIYIHMHSVPAWVTAWETDTRAWPIFSLRPETSPLQVLLIPERLD